MKTILNKIFQKIYLLIFPSMASLNKDYPIYQTKVKDIFLNYAKIGKGPPLVFIHGWTNNWEGWLPVVKYLEKEFTLYLMDMPGFGDSGNLPRYTVSICADYFASFIKNLQPKPQAVIGVSIGSFVAADIAFRYPKLMKHAVLVGCVIRYGHLLFLTQACDLLLKIVHHSSNAETILKKIIETKLVAYFLAKYVNMYRFDKEIVDKYGMIGKKKIRKEAYVEIGISAFSYKLKEVIKKLKIPSLLILGKHDKYTDYRYVEKNILPYNSLINLISISNAGHVVPWEKPKEVAEAIKEFLK